MVVNAGTRDKDLEWLRSAGAGRSASSVEPRTDLAMIAVQGPERAVKAAQRARRQRRARGARARSRSSAYDAAPWFVARTGLHGRGRLGDHAARRTGAPEFWQRLRDVGVAQCGLGARDTLRLEAGMNLVRQRHGRERRTPLESGLAWTVALGAAGRDFIGRRARSSRRRRPARRASSSGCCSRIARVLRSHQKVIVPAVGEGEVTSGTFSPTLERSIGLARVPAATADRCEVEIRGRLLPARVVRPPFVRNGTIAISL